MGMSDPLNYLESIWHHSEPLKVPYSQTSMASANFSPFLTPTPSLRQPLAFQQNAPPPSNMQTFYMDGPYLDRDFFATSYSKEALVYLSHGNM